MIVAYDTISLSSGEIQKVMVLLAPEYEQYEEEEFLHLLPYSSKQQKQDLPLKLVFQSLGIYPGP